MKPSPGNFGVWISQTTGIAYELPDKPICHIEVEEQVTQSVACDLGLVAARLTARTVAFLVLLILERNGELDSRLIAGKERPQRLRFADYLGMTERSFRKWIGRTLAARPGSVLSWGRSESGRKPSRTGGPWSIGVRNTIIEPDSRQALDFIERQRRQAANRRRNPSELLADALRERISGNWIDALSLLEEAEEMFRRRRSTRDSPLWFEILLVLAGTEMQLGTKGLQPRVSANIARSISRQKLGGDRADLIRAQAHYIAALVHNQNEDPAAVSKMLAHLERGRDLLKDRTDDAAVREYLKICSYLELTAARLTGVVQPKGSSTILYAGTADQEDSDEKRMRYGEALLHANRAVEAVDYIRPALDSGRLSRPAWIIAERFDAIARWKLGAKTGRTLEAMERLEREAETLGFAHQVRLIRRAKRKVRSGKTRSV